MPNDKPPKTSSISKFESLEEQSKRIQEIAEDLEATIYTCCNSLIEIGASHQEIIGMLFDMQCTYREAMYDER